MAGRIGHPDSVVRDRDRFRYQNVSISLLVVLTQDGRFFLRVRNHSERIR